MNKDKKIFLISGTFILLVLLVGVTYSFFNYTRTGAANTIQVGRIAFNHTQSSTITLTNIYPIKSTEITTKPDNVGTAVITITGDTEYSDGIEYLLSIYDANITVNNKEIPVSLNITATNIGTSDVDYFENRGGNSSIYKIFSNNEVSDGNNLLVGYIASGSTGVNGSVTIKAYVDANRILITDTVAGGDVEVTGYTNLIGDDVINGRTVFTTTEWNSVVNTPISFKIKVEANQGIWVDNPDSLFSIMKKSAVMDNINSTYVNNQTPGINFGAISSDTNGKGVYMRAGTENDAYPIMYYRGAVTDNNVVFANQCWKAVRTTDTGGVKLIYNGESNPVYDYSSGTPLEENEYTINHDDYGFVYSQNDKAFVTTMPSGNYDLGYFSFKVPNGDGYYAKVEITGNHEYDDGYYYFYVNSNNDEAYDYVNEYPYEKYWPLGTLTNLDTYLTFDDKLYDAYYGPLTIKIQILKNGNLVGYECNNTGSATRITNVGDNGFKFATDSGASNSPAYNGYMYGTVYAYSKTDFTSGAKFGSSFTWDGTNYKLVDANVTTPNATHHYSCNSTDAEATCGVLLYVYYVEGNYKYYITLTGGDGIEEAIEKMQTNTTNSNAKAKIDSWYASNMSEFTNKLEDTIWCNDRSIGRANGWSATGGWGTSYKQISLLYGATERSNYASDTSTVKNQPSLACANKNDRFTVNNGNGNRALTYPIALLTADEIVLAGGVAGLTNGSFYLTNGVGWSLSPYVFSDFKALEFGIYNNGKLDSDDVNSIHGLRPAVSLKPGTPVVSGSGTVADPYVIE